MIQTDTRGVEQGVLPVWFVAISCSAGSAGWTIFCSCPCSDQLRPDAGTPLTRGLGRTDGAFGVGPRKDDRSASLWLLP